jgi:hypothetical protein
MDHDFVDSVEEGYGLVEEQLRVLDSGLLASTGVQYLIFLHIFSHSLVACSLLGSEGSRLRQCRSSCWYLRLGSFAVFTTETKAVHDETSGLMRIAIIKR